MSTTAKARLQTLFTQLDQLFASAHPADVPELIAEIRRDLSSRNSGQRRDAYDKHSNLATNAA